MMNQFSYINDRTEEKIRAILAKEEQQKAATKLYKNREKPKEIVPIDIEKPQEIEGYEIIDVSYRFAYDRSKHLRMEIKDTIYNPINKR